MLGFLAGRNVRPDAYDFEEIMQGECYISKITELEIFSVIGKYGRGAPSQWQNCNRQIAADGTKCTHQFFQKGCKPWNKRLCTHMRKLVKEMIDGTSPIITLHVLDIAQDIIDRAEGFMMHAVKYKFGAQDALIAATAIAHSGAADPLFVVTSDRALMAAMKEEGIDFIVPGITISDS